MQTVRSSDGTAIAVWRSGSGPPLLLVHGATADHSTTWRLVTADLEKRFTVYAMDRRGRGSSGDRPAYALQREAEDVAAVVDAAGRPVAVVGHSYGALAALEASLLTANIRRLVLYEGVPLRGDSLYPQGAAEHLARLVAEERPDDMLVALYRDIVKMPPHEIEVLRAQREAWAVRLSNARTVPRELKEEEAYVFEAARFGAMRTPTLLLVGGDSPSRELENANGVAAALPDARVVVLPGQQHVATYTAPEMFVREVVRFLQE